MTMGVGRGGRGLGPSGFWKLLAKNFFFSISRDKKQISPLLALPGKNFGKTSTAPPLEKILPTPMPMTTALMKRLRNACNNTYTIIYCIPRNAYVSLCKFDFVTILVITTEYIYFRFSLMQIHLNYACKFS